MTPASNESRKWKAEPANVGWRCEECGHEFIHISAPNYCPQCGTKLHVEGE